MGSKRSPKAQIGRRNGLISCIFWVRTYVPFSLALVPPAITGFYTKANICGRGIQAFGFLRIDRVEVATSQWITGRVGDRQKLMNPAALDLNLAALQARLTVYLIPRGTWYRAEKSREESRWYGTVGCTV